MMFIVTGKTNTVPGIWLKHSISELDFVNKEDKHLNTPFLLFPSAQLHFRHPFPPFVISIPYQSLCTVPSVMGDTGVWDQGTAASLCSSLFLSLFLCCSFLTHFVFSSMSPQAAQFLWVCLFYHGAPIICLAVPFSQCLSSSLRCV